MKQNFASALVLGGTSALTHIEPHTESHRSTCPTLSPSSLFVADGGFFGTSAPYSAGREEPDAQPSQLSFERNIQNDRMLKQFVWFLYPTDSSAPSTQTFTAK